MQQKSKSKREVLSCTGSVTIAYSLGRVVVSLNRARNDIAHYKELLFSEQAAELARIDEMLVHAMATMQDAKIAFRALEEASVAAMDAAQPAIERREGSALDS
ncbi:hypothetical protein [Caballeronia grimmiae]|uniref:hypothetical protein n=1 Tax=Caballeronia grimmiae TaxID=1071679 RepID=UPI0038BA57A4